MRHNHMSMESKLRMITQFLLTNNRSDDEVKCELIIDLANYYALKQEWHVVVDLLNTCCMLDSDEDASASGGGVDVPVMISNNGSTGNLADAALIKEIEFTRAAAKGLGFNEICLNRFNTNFEMKG